MMPLVKIGPFALSSFGLTVLIALWFGSWAVDRLLAQRGHSGGMPTSLTLAIIVGGLLGARLWYALFNLDLYQAQPVLLSQFVISALAFPGALAAGGLALWGYTRLRGAQWSDYADPLALVLPFGHALGMLGLLLSGEAYGLPSDLPWAIRLLGVERHPAQIYEALALLALGLALWRIARRRPPAGHLAACYLAGYGAIRLVLEPLRGDSLLLAGSLRSAQIFGLSLMLGACYWLWWRAPQGETSQGQAPAAQGLEQPSSS